MVYMKCFGGISECLELYTLSVRSIKKGTPILHLVHTEA